MNRITKENIAKAIRKCLAKQPLDGLTIEIVERGISKENSCWHVPIRTNKEPRPVSRFYMHLAEIESQVEEDEGLNIDFVPAGDTWHA